MKYIVLIVVLFMITGCHYDETFNEEKHICYEWYEQGTTKYGMEFDGLLPYNFDTDPYEYYYNLAKEFKSKLANCSYTGIGNESVFGCSICYNWENRE